MLYRAMKNEMFTSEFQFIYCMNQYIRFIFVQNGTENLYLKSRNVLSLNKSTF